jgi:hypothetical protein
MRRDWPAALKRVIDNMPDVCHSIDGAHVDRYLSYRAMGSKMQYRLSAWIALHPRAG